MMQKAFRRHKWFTCMVCMLFVLFAGMMTVSMAILRNNQNGKLDSSFDAVVLSDVSEYKHKSTIRSDLVGKEYLFNDVKVTVSSSTSPIYVRAHVMFTGTNTIAKDKLKYNSFEVAEGEGYSWTRFGDYFYLSDESGALMRLTSSEANKEYIFLEQNKTIVPQMTLSDDEYVECEITLNSLPVTSFEDVSNVDEKNQTFTVTFKQGSRTLSMSNANYGGSVTQPTNVTLAAGEVLKCWNTQEDGTGANISFEQLNHITQDLTLYPVLVAEKIQVTVTQSEGGSISPESQQVDYGSSLLMHFVANEGYVLKKVLINGDPVGAMSEYLLPNITSATEVSAEFVQDYIVLNINGGSGTQPKVEYNGDQTKFKISDDVEPTKTGAEFYYYSTTSTDNEQGQNGARYDLGRWYDLPSATSTTLFAIYLTPTEDYTTVKNYVVVPNDVTSIADASTNMFGGTNATVKYITLPRSLTNIGSYAFADCSGLTGVSMSDNVTRFGNYVFKGDTALTSFVAPQDLTAIGGFAFDGCTSLASVTNLENTQITSVSDCCFRNCSALKSLTLPTTVTTLVNNAFNGCKNLANINLESTKLVTIGNAVFGDCTNLKTLELPSTLESIGPNAFNKSGLVSLKNFSGTKVTELKDYTFLSCEQLSSIEIPANLAKIGTQVFYGCSSLASIGGFKSSSIESIGQEAFRACTSLGSVVFPTTLTTILQQAFQSCTNLTSVTLNQKFSTMGIYAFNGCTNLVNINLEDTALTKISDNAFSVCTSLVDITFPSVLQTIDTRAFYKCTGLETISFTNTTNTSSLSVSATAFTGTTSDLKVYVVEEYFDQYISALNGKGFADGAKMYFDGNIDPMARYQDGVWVKYREAIVTSSAGDNGTITPLGEIVYALGSNATYVINPKEGYYISSIKVDGTEIGVTAEKGASQTYAFSDLQADHTISATFAQRTFTVTVTCGENGSISPSETATYTYGENITYTITLAEGYEIDQVLIDGVANSDAKEDGEYTFSNIRADHSISVSFMKKTFTITLLCGEGGSMSSTDTGVTKGWGESYEVTFTPDTNYVISSLTDNGTTIKNDYDNTYIYSISNIEEDHEIICEFESKIRTITFDPNGGTFLNYTDLTLTAGNVISRYVVLSQGPIAPNTTYTITIGMATGEKEGSEEQPTEFMIYLYSSEASCRKTVRGTFGEANTLVMETGSDIKIAENYKLLIYAGLINETNGIVATYSDIAMTVTRTLSYDATIGELPTPTRAGYTFKGWSKTADGEYDDSLESSAYSTVFREEDGWLYAVWEKNTFTISASTNNAEFGTIVGAGETNQGNYVVQYGSSIMFEMAPKDGYRVASYTIDGTAINSTAEAGKADYYTFTNVTQDHKITVTFVAREYTVTFDPNGGSVSSTSKTVTYNSAYGTLPTPTREGYTFGGWFTDDGTQVTASTIVSTAAAHTLYAQWTANKYNVTLNANGGAVSPTTIEVTYDNEYIGLPVPTRTGYTYAGWSKNFFNPELTTNYTSCTRDGGTFTYDTGTTNQSSYSFQIQTWNNTTYINSGMFTKSSTGVGSVVWTKTSDVTRLRFKYNGDKADAQFFYDVSNLPDGDYVIQVNIITMQLNKIVVKDIMIEQNANNTKSAYVSSSSYVTANSQVTTPSDHTLFAHWTVNEYGVTFDPNGGSVSTTSKTVTYDATYGELPTPTRTGYTFAGWFTDGGTQVTSATTVATAANHTLYAHWTANTYVVTLANHYQNWGYSRNECAGSWSSGTFTFTSTNANSSSGPYISGFGGLLVVGQKYRLTFKAKASRSISPNLTVEFGNNIVINTKALTTSYQTITINFTCKQTGGALIFYSSEWAAGDTLSVSDISLVRIVTYDAAYGDLPTPTRTGYTSAGWTRNMFDMGAWLENFVNNNRGVSGGAATYYPTNLSLLITPDSGSTDTYTATYANAQNDYSVAVKPGTQYTFSWTQDVQASPSVMIFFRDAETTTWSGSLGSARGGSLADSGSLRYSLTFTTNSNTKYISVRFGMTNSTAITFSKVQLFEGSSFAYEGIIASTSTVTTPADHTLYAMWTPNTYTVTFDPNGGSASSYTQTVTYGLTYGTILTQTRTGYNFAGWFTAAEGGAQVTASTIVSTSADHTLYAQWTRKEIALTITNTNTAMTSVTWKVVENEETIYSGSQTTSATGPYSNTIYATVGSTITLSIKVRGGLSDSYYGFGCSVDGTAISYETNTTIKTKTYSVTIEVDANVSAIQITGHDTSGGIII